MQSSVLQWHFKPTLERTPFDLVPAVDQHGKLFVGFFIFKYINLPAECGWVDKQQSPFSSQCYFLSGHLLVSSDATGIVKRSIKKNLKKKKEKRIKKKKAFL